MKWDTPKNNEERIIEKFLWLPLILAGEKRWLEYVKIKQIFTNGKWDNIKFIEE